MKRRVRFTRRAERDVRSIQTWLADRSRAGAARWLDALQSAVDRLSDIADSCAPAPEADDLGLELRQCLFRTRHGKIYRLVFAIQGSVVEIVAVRGSGQDFLTSNDLEIDDSHS